MGKGTPNKASKTPPGKGGMKSDKSSGNVGVAGATPKTATPKQKLQQTPVNKKGDKQNRLSAKLTPVAKTNRTVKGSAGKKTKKDIRDSTPKAGTPGPGSSLSEAQKLWKQLVKEKQIKSAEKLVMTKSLQKKIPQINPIFQKKHDSSPIKGKQHGQTPKSKNVQEQGKQNTSPTEVKRLKQGTPKSLQKKQNALHSAEARKNQKSTVEKKQKTPRLFTELKPDKQQQTASVKKKQKGLKLKAAKMVDDDYSSDEEDDDEVTIQKDLMELKKQFQMSTDGDDDDDDDDEEEEEEIDDEEGGDSDDFGQFEDDDDDDIEDDDNDDDMEDDDDDDDDMEDDDDDDDMEDDDDDTADVVSPPKIGNKRAQQPLGVGESNKKQRVEQKRKNDTGVKEVTSLAKDKKLKSGNEQKKKILSSPSNIPVTDINGYKPPIGDAEVKVDESRAVKFRNCRLFMKNLPSKVSEDEIKALSADIKAVRIRTARSKAKQQFNYAFVFFDSEKKAEVNYKKLQGKKLGDKKVVVDYVGDKSEHMSKKVREQGPHTHDKTEYSNKRLYVTGYNEATIDSRQIQALFPKATDVYFPRRKGVKRRGPVGKRAKSHYCFLSFESAVDAKLAHDKMHGHIVDDLPLTVMFAKQFNQDKQKVINMKKAQKKKAKKKEKKMQAAAEKKSVTAGEDGGDSDEDGDVDTDDDDDIDGSNEEIDGSDDDDNEDVEADEDEDDDIEADEDEDDDIEADEDDEDVESDDDEDE